MARGMTIGSLAKAAGVNVETVRYYQRLGLIDEPRRPAGGQRSYPPSSVEKLAFIRRAQQLGFTLAEIGELARLEQSGHHTAIRAMVRARHAKLVAHAEQLAATAAKLERLLEEPRRRGARQADPILAVLRGEEPFPPLDAAVNPSGTSSGKY